MFPAACLAGFGRWPEPFLFFAHALAMLPGLPGSYLRIGYYSLTLEGTGRHCRIDFGSFFAHSKASFGDRVWVGPYCVLGQVDLGEGTLLASAVQILSGTKQHRRDPSGRLTHDLASFRRISVGAHCWVGAGALVMADLGEGSTVGAGSVVSRDVPAGITVVGNPARDAALVSKS
jgi:acetyltransferase-like isoleucine patch superfamily enzyme